MTPKRLNDIWEQLKDLTFYPFSLNWFGNPAVEAGDWLRLEDKQGNSFVVPNSSYTLDFNGGLSATSKADQTTSSDQMVPWQGSVAQTIKELKIRRAPDGTVVFPPSVTTPPTNAKFNDVWFKKNGNSTELWIFEKQDDGSGKWIRKDLSDDEIKKKVADAQQGLNQAKADIINNKQKADVDVENLNKSIEANKKVADESLKKLNDSVTNLQGQYDNNVVPNLNKVMADASDALQKYITAQNSIADLTKQAQQQGKDIADVSNTVKGLNVNYANLVGDVNSTKVDVKGLQTTVGTANGDIAQLKLDAQNLQTMLAGKVDNTTYTNFVNLTNQALNARLTASDLSGYAKTADVQATANGLRVDLNSVTDRMNNLQIGGRNLISNSDADIVVESKTTDAWPAWKYHVVYWDLTPGETYTFSSSAISTNGVGEASVRIFNEAVNKEVGNANFFFPADGKRHSKTFTIPDDGTSYSVYLYAGTMGKIEGKDFTTTYHHPMLQIGNAGTEWSPNPQDIQNDLSQLSARITTTSQQFSSYYTKSETDTKADAAKNDAVNAIKSDGNWQGLSNILTNSGFLQTADGFLQKVQQTTIPMFSGGGVNLVKDTSESEISGKAYDIKDYYFSEPLEPNTKYTISIDAKVDQEALNHQQFIFVDPYTADWSWGAQMSCISASLEYQHYRHTFITPDASQKVTNISVYLAHPDGATNGDRDNLSGTGYFKKLKVERGEIDTPYSHAPSDNASQIAFSELSHSLEGLRSTVGNNYGNLQSQISQSSSAVRTEFIDKLNGVQNQITTTANGLDAKIGAIQVGGRNYLRNSNKSITGWAQDLGTLPNEALNSLAGKTITVSVDVEWNNFTSDSSKQNRLGFEAAVTGSDGKSYWLGAWKNPTTSNGKERVSTQYSLPAGVTFTANNNSANGYVNINGTGKVSHAKIEIGNKQTDWSPAPEDTEQVFTEVNATINGLRSTVSSNHNDLQSQISQTAKNIRQEVSDKTNGLQTQITQQANSFNVSLNKIQQTDGVNLLRGTRDFSGDWDQLNNWYKDGWVDPNGNYAIKRKGAWGGAAQRCWLDVGTYTFSVYYYFEGSDSSTGAWVYVIPNNDKTLKITENSSSSLETAKDKWIKKVYTFTVTTPGTSAVRVETNSNTATIHVGSYKLEKGYKETPWTTSPYDIYMNPNVVTKVLTSVQDLNNLTLEGNYVIKATNNTNSPIGNWLVVRVEGSGDRLHQTISADNDPNLSYTRTFNGSWSAWQRTVTGGNIIAQINMSAGTTLIQNDKIYMDASSTIFSGNAFIPSAAITSLNADKITAGTINGAKVNVINLNANNITAGTLKGSNGEFYLDSGSLHVWQGDHNAWIDKNGIHDSDNSGNNVWISNGSISAYGNSSGAYLFDGGLYLHKSQSLSDAVLNPNYGSITKSDNIVSFGTSGLDIDGKDGFLLRTHGWNDQTLAYLNGNEIIGAGIAGKSDGFMNIAAKKQLFLYAGEPVQNDKLKTIPKLVLDGTYQNGQTALKGTFSQYFFQGPSSGFSGGITLQDEFVNVGSLNGKNYFSISNDGAISITANGKSILSLNGLLPGVNGDFNVSGNFTVTGSKNAVVPTSRGMAAINAYETAEYYFGDIGETQTNSNGVVTVMIDPYFLETVNTLVPYQVFLTSYGDGNVWVSSRSANNFTVKSSNPNIHFAWEIKAKRKGYENDRMKIVKGVFNNEQY